MNLNFGAVAKAAVAAADFPAFLEAAVGPPDPQGYRVCIWCHRPSMYLTPDRRECRCSRCRGRADVLGFAKEHLHLGFMDAVRVIAPQLDLSTFALDTTDNRNAKRRDGGKFSCGSRSKWPPRDKKRLRRDTHHKSAWSYKSVWDVRRLQMVTAQTQDSGLSKESAWAEADGRIRRCLVSRDPPGPGSRSSIPTRRWPPSSPGKSCRRCPGDEHLRRERRRPGPCSPVPPLRPADRDRPAHAFHRDRRSVEGVAPQLRPLHRL